jgi:hypothetical protein
MLATWTLLLGVAVVLSGLNGLDKAEEMATCDDGALSDVGEEAI